MNSTESEVWATIQALNRAWAVEGRPDDLADYFHERMVAVTATDRARLEGRAACVAAWKQFTQLADIHYWREADPRVDLHGDGSFAVVTYYFDMSYDMGGQTVNVGGRDMFALVNEGGRWWVVADQFSAYP
ncbi:MAG: nuclear transport factor 2 family protein [Dehalococcoidia bacterium]